MKGAPQGTRSSGPRPGGTAQGGCGPDGAAGPAAAESPVARAWNPRWAAPQDNRDLIALADACPMEGDVGLCVYRAPDFFALNRLEGSD